MALQLIVLAAGLGKRMGSSKLKVLHELAGKSLIENVLSTAQALSLEPPIVIFGAHGEALLAQLKDYEIRWVKQPQPQGTAQAVLQALPLLADEDQVLVLSGDVPLISAATLRRLLETTPQPGLGLVSAYTTNPFGYGRIKRDAENKISAIVEEKDATEAEKKITEVNAGIYLANAAALKKWLPLIKNENAQQEFYLTDIVQHALSDHQIIHTVNPDFFEEIMGINDKVQLATLERFYQKKLAETWMRAGVTIIDPARFDVRGELTIGREVVIDVNVILEGKVVIGDGCQIGANTIIKNSTLENEVEIRPHSIIEEAYLAAHCIVGPFARIRPGTVLHSFSHIGNFVEVKNSTIGEHTKVSHLSYIGDSSLGKKVNIGAGTITCNYDGITKHKTVIGDRVMVGSDTTLVAPITIHDDAYIATATTVRKDVPAGALVFNTREEKVRAGWSLARKEKISGEK